ncbi:hypothetical protein AVEN_11938-1 [Araneus ventricosus]|uniref:Uncharacterized protein n=1 Tax=Araneus ventricosus TaxID=182803 RepID=A0A4Y2EV25_ARAVE|nr:hypothetical protein AVEN_11938-1 [Araneus ventricosus]
MTRTTSELALLSPSSRTTQTGWHLTTTSDLARTRHIQWNRTANLESPKLEAKTFPPGHRSLPCSCKLYGIHRPPHGFFFNTRDGPAYPKRV